MKPAKKYFITGLLIWIPLAITVWVLTAIIGAMDQSLRLLPEAMHPVNLLGFNIPGTGALLTLLVILLTGLVATNIIGQRLVRFWESLLARIPIVKSIYYSVKQVSDTLFSGNGDAFRKVLLVRYPHPEAWSVAFQSGSPARQISDMLPDEHVSVFIPTAPRQILVLTRVGSRIIIYSTFSSWWRETDRKSKIERWETDRKSEIER